MAELRAAIDALDAELVVFLVCRQTYIERAAVLKQTRAAVRDEARIEDVIAKVVAAAKAAGLVARRSPSRCGGFWIERSIAHEVEAFDARKGETQPSFIVISFPRSAERCEGREPRLEKSKPVLAAWVPFPHVARRARDTRRE